MRYILTVVFILSIMIVNNAGADDSIQTFEWDANIEEDLEGYKIYWGSKSRFTGSVEAIEQWCQENEPDNGQCKNEWLAICKNEDDRACHKSLFLYENEIDVKNVLEYTVKNIPDGIFYFTPTAYDEMKNESSFGSEIKIEFDTLSPDMPTGFRRKVDE